MRRRLHDTFFAKQNDRHCQKYEPSWHALAKICVEKVSRRSSWMKTREGFIMEKQVCTGGVNKRKVFKSAVRHDKELGSFFSVFTPRDGLSVLLISSHCKLMCIPASCI
jgi:hypothetical protein